MKDAAKAAGVPVQFNRCGSMFCGYFTSEPVHNVADAMKSDRERVQEVLPRHAGRGHLPRAIAVRGGIPLHGPHGGGHRADGGRGGQGDEDVVASIERPTGPCP